MDNKINIKINGKDYQITKGLSISEILKEIKYESKYPVLLAKIDNDIKELNYNVLNNCDIQLLDLTTKEGNKALVNALVFVLIYSVNKLYGKDKDINVLYALDKGLYIETNFDITEEDINKIKEEMHNTIKENKDIKKVTVDRMDALKYYRAIKNSSKEENLKYNTNTYITFYKLGDLYDYFYTKMPINTSSLSDFNLTYIDDNSFILNYPTIYIKDEVPEYHHHLKIFNVYNNNKEWSRLMKLENASDLNKIVSSGKIDEFIRICENRLANEFSELAQNIVSDPDNKLVLMAGPSSSGKTTSSKKLCMALKALGKNPTVISMDDYFVDRDETPVDEFGEKDYECLEALDLKLFNKQVKELLNGEKVVVPTYNFMIGKKEFKNELKLEEDDILVIEGIHALDNKILTNVARANKYKIYVSALTELNIDNHNRISTTDNRLLRRIIRDNKTRNHSVEDTLDGWASVRRGEEKYIFPYQDEVDYTLNTALLYELGVMKTYVEPLLYSVQPGSIYYSEAKRLINFLKVFLPIPADAIPQDSIIREFIGGSCF